MLNSKGEIKLIISSRLTSLLEHVPKRYLKILATIILNRKLKKYANLHIEGMKNIEDINNKPIIFICNHLSNSDGLIFNKVLEKYSPTFVAGVKLKGEAVTNFGTIVVKTTPIIPNSPDKGGLSKIVKILKSGENIFIFPEGTRSRTASMNKATRGLHLIAKMSKAIIVPIGICGSEKLLPIGQDGNMSNETFYEADVYIKIGNPFYMSEKNDKEDKKQYEERAVDEAMRKIAELLPESYRGVYN